jgi:hypothetical protein
LQAALYPDNGGGVPRQVQELLIGVGMLDNELSFAVYREHLRPTRLLQASHVSSRIALEIGKGVDIAQIDHGCPQHECSCFFHDNGIGTTRSSRARCAAVPQSGPPQSRPTSVASFARTSATTAAGAGPAGVAARARQARLRTWSASTTPVTLEFDI